MDKTDERLIKPPIEQVVSGRVFRPVYAFLAKKVLKVTAVLVLLWCVAVLLLFTNPFISMIAVQMFGPLFIAIELGYANFSMAYWIGTLVFLFLGSLYTLVYIRRIEYSVLGWEGEAMPEIMVVKGIVNITKKFVPFRNITNIETKRGPFDRLLGIGTLVIETAGGAPQQPTTGLAALLIKAIASSSQVGEQRIEGIRFHQELRDFVLQEMRGFEKGIERGESSSLRRIFTPTTLKALQEVRDALKEAP
jgi:membrane protein YdbS with pleckstrin-like domain